MFQGILIGWTKPRGGFLKSWAHGVKRIQIWEKMQYVGRKAQIHDVIRKKSWAQSANFKRKA